MTDHRETASPDDVAALRLRAQALQEQVAAQGMELDALRRHDGLLQAVIDGTTDAVFVKDIRGRYVMLNSTVAQIMGRPKDQIIGQHDSELFPEPTVSQLVADDQSVMSSGQPQTCEAVIPVAGRQRTFLSTKTAFRDQQGEVVGLIGISRDITERKQAEQALRESEERLDQIVESAMDAIVTIDAQRTVRLFNAAAESVFRVTADQAIGQSFDRFASPALRELLDRCMHAFKQPHTDKRYTWAPQGLTAVRADGDEFPVEATISQAEAIGQVLYTLILRDVNDRQKAEEELSRLQLQNVYLQEQVGREGGGGEIVGGSPGIQAVLHNVQQVAGTDSTVLITGETGTGKELVASAIHNSSKRSHRLLVKVNCPALPGGLIESELFGHEKGAFTGALSRKIGRFEMADTGTIFLDEIGDLPLELQAKLLRVLQTGEFERIGGSKTFRVDVRVIAATNRDLEQAIAEKLFRPDLYYRLNVFPVRIPPLRERTKDIPLLVRHFAMMFGAKMGKRIETIPQKTMDSLAGYSWPGNIRELQNVLERAVILSRGTELELGEWPPRATCLEHDTSVATLAEFERRHIVKALESSGWRVSGERGAAKLLGLKPTTLEARMKKHGIYRTA